MGKRRYRPLDGAARGRNFYMRPSPPPDNPTVAGMPMEDS